jgi:hypothetical protein
LLVIQETGRREGLVFASATALCRSGESESAPRRRNTVRIPLVPPDGARPTTAKEQTNLQGIYDLQLSRPELTPLEPHPASRRQPRSVCV